MPISDPNDPETIAARLAGTLTSAEFAAFFPDLRRAAHEHSFDNGTFTLRAYRDNGHNAVGWYEMTLNTNHPYLRQLIDLVLDHRGLELEARGALRIRKTSPPWEEQGEQ